MACDQLTGRINRNRAQFARCFDGLEVVPPGVVPINDWLRDGPAPPPQASNRDCPRTSRLAGSTPVGRRRSQLSLGRSLSNQPGGMFASGGRVEQARIAHLRRVVTINESHEVVERFPEPGPLLTKRCRFTGRAAR
jgi:hypothetical protein